LSSEFLNQSVEPEQCGLASLGYLRSQESANPIREADRPMILLALESVAKADANPIVRRAAACAWHPLKWMSERPTK
jgi:hypothetical protein